MRTRRVIAFIFMTQQPLVSPDLLFVQVSRSHSDTPHSVGLLWTSDQPDAETSTRQNTTLTTDRHPYLGGIRTHNPSKRAAAYPLLKPRGHWIGMPLLRCRFLTAEPQVRSQNLSCGFVGEQIQLGQVCSVYCCLYLGYIITSVPLVYSLSSRGYEMSPLSACFPWK